MTRFLFDADVFLCIKKFDLLDLVFTSIQRTGREAVITEYVARHELSAVASVVHGLENSGRLSVIPVKRRGRFKDLREAGADKGEAEALTWALEQADVGRILFVSLDRKARQFATSNGIRATDLFDLCVGLIESGMLSLDQVQARLVDWEDKRQQFGRPADFTSFAETHRARISNFRVIEL